jgi:hypothetical protein
MPVSPALLSLSDDQITTVMAAARVLEPADREPFLQLLAAETRRRRSLSRGPRDSSAGSSCRQTFRARAT